jgi:predicted DNA-binding transcriptional regulator AlpA
MQNGVREAEDVIGEEAIEVHDLAEGEQLGEHYGPAPRDCRAAGPEAIRLLGLSPALLSVTETAARLGVCRRTVWNLIRMDARFPRKRKLGGRVMFLTGEVEDYIRNLADDAGGRAA